MDIVWIPILINILTALSKSKVRKKIYIYICFTEKHILSEHNIYFRKLLWEFCWRYDICNKRLTFNTHNCLKMSELDSGRYYMVKYLYVSFISNKLFSWLTNCLCSVSRLETLWEVAHDWRYDMAKVHWADVCVCVLILEQGGCMELQTKENDKNMTCTQYFHTQSLCVTR